MTFKTWRYLCWLGFKNLWRNRVYTAASIFTMSACIFLFGVFYAAGLNIDSIIQRIEEDIYVTVFFDEEASPEEVEAIGGMIRKRPEVLKTVYTSSDEAWMGLQDSFFEDEALLEGIFEDDNPLEYSENYQVYIRGIDQQERFVSEVEGMAGVRKVVHSMDTVKALLGLKTVISRMSMGSLGIILVISLLLIHNTLAVGVEAQKEKTHVMRLMGGREAFIRVPFLVEGVIMAMAGVCIPLVCLLGIYQWGMDLVAAGLQLYDGTWRLLSPSQVFPKLIQALFLLGGFTGIVGSLSVMGKLKSLCKSNHL